MSPIRVLIIEDDQDVSDLLKTTLEPEYECLVATNGLEGMQMAFEGEPDLIISDIMMPVMDGHEFVKRLRSEPELSDIPIIFLSALGGREQIRKGYDLGATLYLTKPIDPGRLRRNVSLFVKDHDVKSRTKKDSVETVQARHRPVDIDVEPPKPPREETTAARAKDASGRSAAGPPSGGTADKTVKAEPVTRELFRRSHPHQNRVRILLVEDDRDAAEMMRSKLEKQYDVLTSNDGMDAIERAVRYKPDIFIIDGMLPKMTGYQLVHMLRKNRNYRDAPIIFVSGKATTRDRQYVQKLGIEHFLAKPFQMAQLEEILAQITSDPNFKIREERLSHQQIAWERFREFETHRR